MRRPELRPGGVEDATAIAALAIQVFLDTYATEGVRPDLGREAFCEYGVDRFASRLREPGREFTLAWRDGGLLGFAELRAGAVAAPAGEVRGAELVRLYVQPRFQRCGIGKALLTASEEKAARAGATSLWLTVWERNDRAIAFYDRAGYVDVGQTSYTFQGRTYGNRVYYRPLHPPG